MTLLIFVSDCRWLRANRQKVWDSNPTCRGPRDLGGRPVEDMTFEDLCDGQWASMVKLTPRVPIRWQNIIIISSLSCIARRKPIVIMVSLLSCTLNCILYFYIRAIDTHVYYTCTYFVCVCVRACACVCVRVYCFFCF